MASKEGLRILREKSLIDTINAADNPDGALDNFLNEVNKAYKRSNTTLNKVIVQQLKALKLATKTGSLRVDKATSLIKIERALRNRESDIKIVSKSVSGSVKNKIKSFIPSPNDFLHSLTYSSPILGGAIEVGKSAVSGFRSRSAEANELSDDLTKSATDTIEPVETEVDKNSKIIIEKLTSIDEGVSRLVDIWSEPEPENSVQSTLEQRESKREEKSSGSIEQVSKDQHNIKEKLEEKKKQPISAFDVATGNVTARLFENIFTGFFKKVLAPVASFLTLGFLKKENLAKVFAPLGKGIISTLKQTSNVLLKGFVKVLGPLGLIITGALAVMDGIHSAADDDLIKEKLGVTEVQLADRIGAGIAGFIGSIFGLVDGVLGFLGIDTNLQEETRDIILDFVKKSRMVVMDLFEFFFSIPERMGTFLQEIKETDIAETLSGVKENIVTSIKDFFGFIMDTINSIRNFSLKDLISNTFDKGVDLATKKSSTLNEKVSTFREDIYKLFSSNDISPDLHNRELIKNELKQDGINREVNNNSNTVVAPQTNIQTTNNNSTAFFSEEQKPVRNDEVSYLKNNYRNAQFSF